MAVQMGIPGYQEVEVLGGSAYVDIVRTVLEGYPVTVIAPYTGCGGIRPHDGARDHGHPDGRSH